MATEQTWRIELELRDDGCVYANGEVEVVSGMSPEDRRGPWLRGEKLIFRRDVLRKRLREVGVSLPRGAKFGARWTVTVTAELLAWWKGGCGFDDVESFEKGEEDEADGFVIFAPFVREEIPVTREHLVAVSS
jgi:hypothetical protein